MTRRVLLYLLAAGVIGALVWTTPSDRDDTPTSNQEDEDGKDAGPLLTGMAPPPAESEKEPEPAAPASVAQTGYALDPPPAARAQTALLGGGDLSAGSLEGLLLQDDRPLPEGEGLLWRVEGATAGDLPKMTSIPAGRKPDRVVAVGKDGVFRFDGLEDGVWMIGYRLDDGVQRVVYLPMPTGKRPMRRSVMAVGKSEVFGSVYDADGQVASSAVVRVNMSNGIFAAQTHVDAAGRYRIGRLRPGMATVSVALRGDLDDETQTSHRVAAVPRAGSVEVSFGSNATQPRIQGVVQCADGAPVRGPGGVALRDRTNIVIVKYDERGRFSQRIPPGTYQVKLSPPPSGYPLVGLGTLRVDHDLADIVWVLRRARVEGRIRRSDGSLLPKVVHVELRDTKGSQPRRKALVRPNGTYTFYGVSPGIVHARVVGHPAQVVEFVIASDAVVLTQDFTLKPDSK